MTHSLKNALQIAGCYLDNELISSNAVLDIGKIADLLPNLPVVSQAGFECHLGSSKPRTDFLAAFTTLNQGRETLINSDSLVFANPIWNKVHDFCIYWANSKYSLYENVDNIWLEFDIDKHSLEVPEPSLFFGPKKIKRKEVASCQTNWVADEALPLLLGKPIPKEVKKQLLKCFNLLPPNGEIFQIGVMLPRKSESQIVRLCVENIPNEQILDYLINIGWSDSSDRLSSLLSELSGFVDVIRLNFAIEDTVFPKIGLECYLHKQPQNSPKWKLFQNYLVKNKLCSFEEANALSNWSGYSEEKENSELWQDNFRKASALVSPNFKSTIVRLLHHIKIVYQPARPLQAKAYLWFGHRWLSQNGSFKE